MRTMRKIIVAAIAAIVGVLMFGFFGTVDVAVAQTPTSGSSVSFSNSSSTVTSSTTSVVSSDVKGKVNLAFQTPTGFKTSASCVRVNYPSQRGRHTCFILMRKGVHYQNSGISRNGVRYYFDDYVGSKYTPVGSRFYYDGHYRTWRKSNCGNFSRFVPARPALKVASVALVKSFSNVTVTVKVTANAQTTATATAWCSTDSSAANATAQATATGTASATATASAMTVTKATATAVNAVKVTVSDQALANAKASASATATAQASALAVCTSTPPQQAPPTVVSLEQPNDVYPNESRTICATVNVPSPDSGTVVFSAQTGTFSNGTQAVASGTTQLCANYTGPGEVPASGTDTVTASVFDSTTGLHDQKSVTFVVKLPPPPPA